MLDPSPPTCLRLIRYTMLSIYIVLYVICMFCDSDSDNDNDNDDYDMILYVMSVMCM